MLRAVSSDDITTTFDKLTGTIEIDVDNPGDARAEVSVDMRSFQAGDWFNNWKLKGELAADTNPTAKFVLMRFDALKEVAPGQLEAVAIGQLQWRGRSVDVRARGKATVNRRSIEARATFDVVVSALGVTPPQFLMFKGDDRVRVDVTLSAAPG